MHCVGAAPPCTRTAVERLRQAMDRALRAPRPRRKQTQTSRASGGACRAAPRGDKRADMTGGVGIRRWPRAKACSEGCRGWWKRAGSGWCWGSSESRARAVAGKKACGGGGVGGVWVWVWGHARSTARRLFVDDGRVCQVPDNKASSIKRGACVCVTERRFQCVCACVCVRGTDGDGDIQMMAE